MLKKLTVRTEIELRNFQRMGQGKTLLGTDNQSYLTNLNKNNIRTLAGGFLGHCKLKGHMNKLRLAKESEWIFCGEQNEKPQPTQ